MRLQTRTNLITGLVVAVPIGVIVAGASMLLSGDAAPTVETQAPIETLRDAGPVADSAPKALRPTATRYESVAEYFRAGNPNATTYRLGEPPIDRQSFSAKQRATIHRENGGVCQVCGSEGPLEVEHRRGLQNGGGNERENLGSLCIPCHNAKTAMDKSLRRQRDKLLRSGAGKRE